MRKRHIPSQNNFKPSTQRKPIYRRNDRLLACPPTYSCEPTERMSHLSWIRLDFPTPNLAKLNEILSCTEGFLACPSDDGHTEIGLIVEPFKDLIAFEVTREWNTVHGAFTIYGDEQDVGRGVREEDVHVRRRVRDRFGDDHFGGGGYGLW